MKWKSYCAGNKKKGKHLRSFTVTLEAPDSGTALRKVKKEIKRRGYRSGHIITTEHVR